MRSFVQSDIFNYLNKGNSIQSKIFNVLNGKAGAVVLNTKVTNDINSMVKIFKEPIVLKTVAAINNGEILLVKIPADYNLPDFLPFVKHRKNDKERVIVNVSKYLTERKDPDTHDIEYHIDPLKLYALCIPAYVTLKLFDSNTVLSPDAIKYSALLWARMFNKILVKTIALSTNKDRYEAFMYFAMRFFMVYYLEMPEPVVNRISESYLVNGKTYLIEYMETKIKELGLKPYLSFTDFCTTLFNNEVSNIKGIRINNIEEKINISFYLKKFADMYYTSTWLSLAAYPYFLFSVFASFNKTNICNDRSMEDVILYDKKEVPKLLASLYKDLKN